MSMDVVSLDYKPHQLRSQLVPPQNVYHSIKTKNTCSCFLHKKNVVSLFLMYLVPNHITYHKSSTVSAKDL